MVNESLRCVLDGLKEIFVSNYIEPDFLYSWFRTKNFLDHDEVYKIASAGIPSEQINVFCDMMKSKSDDVFLEIHKMTNMKKWNGISDFVEQNLKEMGFANLLNRIPESHDVDNMDASSVVLLNQEKNIYKIRKDLKTYLQTDVQVMFKYWDKLGVSRVDHWKNFYNSDMIITDNFGKHLPNVDTFAALFECLKLTNFNRIIVSAPAGYGKSTFAHEMVSQWVNDYKWAQQFSLVFLFRLGEIQLNASYNKENPLTLKSLIEKCICESEQVLTDEVISKSLFVFDGFDELQRELISDEVYDFITGHSKYKPYVMVTSRPDNSFERLKGACNVYIELKGFTEKGIVNQFKKFDVHFLAADLPKDIVKVPLFATLFGILHKEKATTVTNPCSLIHNTVKYLVARYQKSKPEFSDKNKTELLFMLGQAAQAQFAFFRFYDGHNFLDQMAPRSAVSMPDFYATPNNYLLDFAKSAYLILPSSHEKQIFFPHQMFAYYCAAFFWSNRNQKYVVGPKNYIDNIHSVDFFKNIVRFKDHNYCCDSSSWFSMFLSYFNVTYKNALWKMLEDYSDSYKVKMPLLENFDDLPCIQLKASTIYFVTITDRMACSAMKKLKFLNSVTLYYLRFDASNVFDTLSCVEELYLWNCQIRFSGQNFLAAYNAKSLGLHYCTFEYFESNADSSCGSHQVPKLDCLTVSAAKGHISNFLVEMIKAAENLKSISVISVAETDWVNSLLGKNVLEGEIIFGNPTVQPSFSMMSIEEAMQILKSEFVSSRERVFTFDCKFV